MEGTPSPELDFSGPDPPGGRKNPSLGQLGKSLLPECCSLRRSAVWLGLTPARPPGFLIMKDGSAKTYLTKNTSSSVIRNPKPGRIF